VNILYIEHYAGTPSLGMEHRPYYLARQWVHAGHAVRIIAASYSHYRAHQPSIDTTTKLCSREIIDSIEYDWIHTPSYTGNGIGRVRNIFTFLFKLRRLSAQIIREFKPDMVIASSTYPMDIYVAHHISHLSHAKLIFELHDLWPLSPIEVGKMSPYHPFMILCQHAENYAYAHADAVVSILPKVHEHVEKHGLALHKLHIIPNGINSGDWVEDTAALSEEMVVCYKKWRKNRFVVGYAGQHGVANALDTFIQAALRMPEIGFVLVGHGQEKERLQREADHADNILFLDAVPKKAIPYLLSSMDALYIGWKHSPLYRYGISPNKLIDYMMSGKPIIHAVDAGNDDVREAGCGLSIPPEDIGSLMDAIHKLAQYTDAQRVVMGNSGKKYVTLHHEYSILAEKFLAVMRELQNS